MRVASIALATGWPPSEVRTWSLGQLGAVEDAVTNAQRARRMARARGR